MFRFIVQEAKEPYALSVIALSPSAIDLAESKVDRALAIWGQCLREKRWPGYPNRTCYVDPPAWHEAQYLEREARDHDAALAHGGVLLGAAVNWDAPL